MLIPGTLITCYHNNSIIYVSLQSMCWRVCVRDSLVSLQVTWYVIMWVMWYKDMAFPLLYLLHLDMLLAKCWAVPRAKMWHKKLCLVHDIILLHFLTPLSLLPSGTVFLTGNSFSSSQVVACTHTRCWRGIISIFNPPSSLVICVTLPTYMYTLPPSPLDCDIFAVCTDQITSPG